jgi:eukaryotic-like serine/threonine-protein kinase
MRLALPWGMEANGSRQGLRLIGSRYDLMRVIDRGGYAIVYEAEDRRLNRTVALKMVLPDHPDPAAAARLKREAQVMASITHPNVCGVSDAGMVDDGRPFFVMDRLQGETLRGLLNRELVVEAQVAIDLIIELLSALHAVHAGGTVHRDVKPENIFLAERNGCRPSVKLLDFGCCGPMASREPDDCLTRDWHVVGTAAYMAPEQAAGSRLFHAGTDIFAAALVLLEALTGFQPPARGNQEPLPALSTFRSDLPAALDTILGRALSPDPRQRYRSTTAFAKDLMQVRSLCEPESTPVSVRVPASQTNPFGIVPAAAPGPMRARHSSYVDDETAPARGPIFAPPARARASAAVDARPVATPSKQHSAHPAQARALSNADDDATNRSASSGPPMRRAPSETPPPSRVQNGSAVPSNGRASAYAIHDDATHHFRRVKVTRAKDTIREHDDEDTPLEQQRLPLRIHV